MVEDLINPALHQIPIRIFWDGWTSTTYELHRSGWEVFASEDSSPISMARVLCVALTSPNKDMMVYGEIQASIAQLRSIGHYNYFGGQSFLETLRDVGIKAMSYKLGDRVLSYTETYGVGKRMASLRPAEPFAYFPVSQPHTITIGELSIFKYKQPSEIIIPARSVDDCLNEILKLQHADIKAAKASGSLTPHATIYSLAS